MSSEVSSNLYDIYHFRVNKLLMMGRGTARNTQSFMPKQICEISASSWFYYKEVLKSYCFTSLTHYYIFSIKRETNLFHLAEITSYFVRITKYFLLFGLNAWGFRLHFASWWHRLYDSTFINATAHLTAVDYNWISKEYVKIYLYSDFCLFCI